MEYITRFSDMTNTALRRHTPHSVYCPKSGHPGLEMEDSPRKGNTGGGASEKVHVFYLLGDEMPSSMHTVIRTK